MNAKHLWIAMTLLTGSIFASPAAAAVEPLSALANPTLQALINRGNDPIYVGGILFSNFALLNTLPGTGVTADQIQVQPFTTGGEGMQFVSSWFAANGTYVDEVLTFNAKAIDPSKPIGQINLLSNGTAPVPTAGTFTSTTLISQLIDGTQAAPVLSTYNDGITFPTDTTKPDINFEASTLDPQITLHIIDTIFESSTAPGTGTSGGVATESIVQNAFVSVPEPDRVGWMLLIVTGLISTFGRKRMAPRADQGNRI